MSIGGERAGLADRKTYHNREREKASRKLREWQRRYDLHTAAAWEAEKRLLEDEILDDLDTQGF